MQEQTKKSSLVESVVDLIVGIVLSLTVYAVANVSFNLNISWHDNLLLTAIFTILSFIRKYYIRRVFVYLHKSGKLI